MKARLLKNLKNDRDTRVRYRCCDVGIYSIFTDNLKITNIR